MRATSRWQESSYSIKDTVWNGLRATRDTFFRSAQTNMPDMGPLSPPHRLPPPPPPGTSSALASLCLHLITSGHMTSLRHTHMITSTPPLEDHSKNADWHGISGCLDSNPDEDMPTTPHFGIMTSPLPHAPIVNTDTTPVSTVMSLTAHMHTLLSARGRLHGPTPLRPPAGGQQHTDVIPASPGALVCPSRYSPP